MTRRHRDPVRGHLHARSNQTLDDDRFLGPETACNDTQSLVHRTKLDRPVFDLVASTEHEHVATPLVGADCLIIDQDGLARSAGGKLHPRKQAGNESAVGIGEHRAGADRAGGAIDAVAYKIQSAGMRMAVLGRKANADRKRAALLIDCFGSCLAEEIQIGRLVDIEIDLHGID